MASYYIALAKLHLAANRFNEAFVILTATIKGNADNRGYSLAATDVQLAWCYRQRAELYGLIGDRVNEKKDLISRFNCFKITASQKPIPYQGDRAILAKFMFHQPASQTTQDVTSNQQSSLKNEM